MIRPALATLTSCALLLLWVANVWAQSAAVTPPGSRMSIVPPEGFDLSASFSGFENRETGASILFVEMPAEAYAQLGTAFTEERMAQQGMQLLGIQDLKGSPFEGFVVEARQEAGGLLYHKWMVVMSAPTLTGLVTFNVPEATVDRLDPQAIRASLLSLRTTQATANPIDNLPFTAIESERLRIVDTLAGTTVIYKERGIADGQEPVLFTIGASFEHEPSASLRSYTDQLVRSIDAIRVAAVDTYSDVEIDGLPGLEAQGRCNYVDTGQPCWVFQIVLLDERRYYRFLGLVPGDDPKDYFAEFRALARGFKRK